MEVHIGSHRWEHRAPDWPAAAVSGFVAGAVLMVVELLWTSIILGISPWGTSHKIAAILMGADALQSTGFSIGSVALALAIHYVLGIVFGLLLCAVIAPMHMDSSLGLALLVGAVFGLALYVFNFYGMTFFLPWFVDMRGLATLVAHLVFGMTAAAMYWKLKPPDVER
jgi:uncharacterized membrane protein